jgi:SAM-dependent methyltransferase
MKTKFNKDYYTDGIAKGLSCYENYRWIPELTYPMAHAFFNFLHLHRKSNVLEFGCAHGFLVKCLIDFGVNAFGIDVSEYAIRNSHTGIGNRLALIKNNNIKNSLKKLNFKKKFDWIISKDVFEHIPASHLKKLLMQMTKITNKLFVIVPLGDKSKYRIKQYHLDKTHIIIKNEKWWINLFENNGFSVVNTFYKVDGIKDKWYKINKSGNGFFVLKSKKNI